MILNEFKQGYKGFISRTCQGAWARVSETKKKGRVGGGGCGRSTRNALLRTAAARHARCRPVGTRRTNATARGKPSRGTAQRARSSARHDSCHSNRPRARFAVRMRQRARSRIRVCRTRMSKGEWPKDRTNVSSRRIGFLLTMMLVTWHCIHVSCDHIPLRLHDYHWSKRSYFTVGVFKYYMREG